MTDVCYIVNDPERAFIADLFLDFLGLDRASQSYRRIRNAVLLLSVDINDFETACGKIAELENTSQSDIAHDIKHTLCGLGSPVDELFDRRYGTPYRDGTGGIGFMPHTKDHADTVAFLGKTLLYIMRSNYI